MQLIIDLDNIQDTSKKEFLLNTLKFLKISFKAGERPQTLDEYNADLEEANDEIDKMNYTTMDDLLKEMEQW